MHLSDTCFRLVLAALLGGIIGYEREKKGTYAGLRTHMLVCLGSALVMTVSLYMVSVSQKSNFDAGQIAGAVMSGVGFIGAGTIIRNSEGGVSGITTASSIWIIAGIGLAIGCGYLSAAFIGTAITFCTLFLLKRFEPEGD